MKKKENLNASIVIPMYNAGKNIKELFDSLNNQTEKNFEVIIVDDGSTDNSIEIVKKSKVNFPLKMIRQKNSGPAAARNKGIKNAKSNNLVVFLDSDCMPENEWFYKIKEFFKDKNFQIVFGSLNNGDDDIFSNALDFSWGYKINDKNKKGERDLVTSANMIVRKKVLDEILFNEHMIMAEDSDFSVRARKRGFKIYFNPEIKVFHKHKRDSLSQFLKHRKEHGSWAIYNLLKYKNFLKEGKFIPKNNFYLFVVACLFIWIHTVLKVIKGNFKNEPKVLLYLPLILIGNACWTLGVIKGYKKYHTKK
jgi:glycosyltransferase involved in cell wall biosynthesis